MNPRIYTAGYTGSTPEKLAELAKIFDAIVCDVRFSRASRVPRWRDNALASFLGDRYEWRKDLGGVRYQRGGGAWGEPSSDAVDALVRASAERSRILLCACKCPGDCHRHHELVPPLRRRGIAVTHIWQPTRDLIDADELARSMREGTDYACMAY